MSYLFETNLQGYMHPSTAQRLGYEGLLATLPKSFFKKHALWKMVGRDEYGTVTREGIFHNLILDVGGTAFLQNTYNTAGSTVAIFKYAALTQETASTTLTLPYQQAHQLRASP